MASAQPRLKKQRRNPPESTSTSHLLGKASRTSITSSAASMPHSLHSSAHLTNGGKPSSSHDSAATINGKFYPARAPASVREVIAGQEREVIVLSDDGEDDDAPPARPLAADAYENASSSKSGRYRAPISEVAPPVNGTLKGKRKALDGDVDSHLDLNATDATTKRRKRDDVLPSGAASAAALPSRSDAFGPNSIARPNHQDQQQIVAKPRPAEYVPKYAPPALPVDDKEGHFIVRKGENVSDRYKIMQQLGQGTFGKVVECWDRHRQRYVAIKIIRAIQKYRDASQIEIRVLRALSDADPTNENKCIHLIDTFSYRNHVCIVSELLGQSVFDFLKENQFASFPPRHIWSFAKQLLQSVAFLHRLNLVHTDLKPENILLVQSDYENVPLSKRANARRKRVLKNSEIRLIDFGSATFDHEYHSQVVSTRHYRAPEIILQMGWTFPCDAWSIGCILVEFYTGDALFQTHDNLEHLAMMEVVLGPMPDELRRKASTYKPDYFRGGKLNYPNAETGPQSKRYMKRMKRLQDIVSGPAAFQKHNSRFLHLLQRLLAWDPEQRIKVADALNHPYFDLVDSEFPGPPCPNSATS